MSAAPPILVLTAGATAEERQRCERAGIEAFMTRPVEREGLRAALAPWIGARRDSASEPDAAIPGAPEPKLVRVFVQEADERIGAMRTTPAGSTGLEAVGRHAHTIGSTSRHFPGTEVTDRARHIEALANAGDLVAVCAEFPDLGAAWTALRAELIRRMGADASPARYNIAVARDSGVLDHDEHPFTAPRFHRLVHSAILGRNQCAAAAPRPARRPTGGKSRCGVHPGPFPWPAVRSCCLH